MHRESKTRRRCGWIVAGNGGMLGLRIRLCAFLLLLVVNSSFNEQHRPEQLLGRDCIHKTSSVKLLNRFCHESSEKNVKITSSYTECCWKNGRRLRGGGGGGGGGGGADGLSDIEGDISVVESPTPRESSPPPYYPPPGKDLDISFLFDIPNGTVFTRDVKPEDPNLTYWRTPIEKDLGWTGPVWGEDCPEATIDPPPGYVRPWGDCEDNETFIGCYDDGTPAHYGEVADHFRHEQQKFCHEYSDSREHVPELLYLYRQRPNYTNMTEFDPKVHEGFTGWIGRGSTPKEEIEDEYSDGGWGITHYEVGRSTQYVNVPMQYQDFMRVGKDDREKGELSDQGSSEASGDSAQGDGECDDDMSSGKDNEARCLLLHNRSKAKPWQQVLEAHGRQYMKLPEMPDYCEIPAERADDEPEDVLMSTKLINGSRIPREEDACRLWLEGYPINVGITEWTDEEVEHEMRLRQQKWIKWRKWFEQERDKRRPLWCKNLTEWHDFNMTFVDLNGKRFPASKGRTPCEVRANTISDYLKDVLDRAAHKHRQYCKEREESFKSVEDPTVSPWLERNGYRFRLRQVMGGTCLRPEVQLPGSPWVFGSEEAKKTVEKWIEENTVNGSDDCWNCMDLDISQDEEFYCNNLEKNPQNASALCDYGVLLYRQGREQEAEEMLGRALDCPIRTAAGANFPPHVTAYHNLAVMKAYAGKMEEAESFLRKSLALYPENDRVLTKLGEIMEDEHKDFNEAEKLYSKAFDLNNYGKEHPPAFFPSAPTRPPPLLNGWPAVFVGTSTLPKW
eukprot:757175-Hanusia_phi.AAC.11